MAIATNSALIFIVDTPFTLLDVLRGRSDNVGWTVVELGSLRLVYHDKPSLKEESLRLAGGDRSFESLIPGRQPRGFE